LALLLLTLAAWYGASLRPQHGWSDDGASHIRHAQNILVHRPYEDMRYGQAPAVRAPEPIYPPALPLLLAPLPPFWGVNFSALKAAMLAISLLSLATSWMVLRTYQAAEKVRGQAEACPT
jgi:hypothetical protein